MHLIKYASFLAAGVVLLTGLGLAPAARGADTAPSGVAVSVRVINLARILQGLDAKKRIDADLDTLSQDLVKERKNLEDQIEKTKGEIAAYKPETEPYREALDRLMRKSNELQGFPQFMEQKMMLEQRLRTMELYRLIDKAVADYAKTHNLGLVLVADDGELGGLRTTNEVTAKISFRKVMFAAEGLDISAAIVEKINTEGKAGTGK